MMEQLRNKKKILLRYTATLCLLGLILLCPAFSYTAHAETTPSAPIRVGVFPLGNFQNFDENGKPYGYNISYLKKVAELTHWEYEYIQTDNWVQATEMLERGELDLLAPAQNIPSLSGRFSYAAFPMGTEAAAIYVPADRNDLVYQDFERMKKLRFGGAEGSTFVKNFLTRAEEKGFTPDLTYYENTTALFDALAQNEVDAIVSNILFDNTSLKIIDRFSPLPVYYISSKDNSALLDRLYDAMCTIELEDPSFETRLMAEFFPFYSNSDFTYDELEYISSMSTINVGFHPKGAPISYVDEGGQVKGISADILQRVSEISGLKFNIIPLLGELPTRDALSEQGIYVLCDVSASDFMAYESSFWFSKPYMETERVLISTGIEDVQPGMRLAAPACYGEDALKEAFPGLNIIFCEQPEESFQMLARKEVDFLLSYRYVAEPLLSKPAYRNYKTLSYRSINGDLCIGTFHDTDNTTDMQRLINDDRFLSIVNKSIQRIGTEEMNAIIIRHTAESRYHYTLWDFIYQYWHLLSIIGLLFLLCIVCAITINRMKTNENRVLSRAIDQANQASRAKSRFLSNMSHEIRTPLNAIVGMTDLAQKNIDKPEKTCRYLEKIEDSSKLLISIINDVLDMSAIESEKLKISSQTFDFKAVLSSLSELYYNQCRNKGIRFQMQLDGVKHEVLVGDSLRINQILMNLLSNAFKFTGQGGSITVTVSETMVDEEKRQVFMRFVVADTGSGMSSEMLSRLFEAFEQESADTARQHGGSGLGLAITKNLVDLMHGAISATSEKGVGTTFTVDIPFGITDDVILADPQTLRHIRMLIVDDDDYMREYVASILEDMGVRYETAADGNEALHLLREAAEQKDPFHACFLDWRMPEMDGMEVAKEIRDHISKDILTIIISAYDLSEVREEAESIGIDQFISKPLFQSSIYNVLAGISGKRSFTVSAEKETYDFTGRRALLAEDFDLNREVAVDLLSLVSLETDCAVNGREAVEKFTASAPGTYDIIFMDIQMPEMDGYEAIRRIRASSHPQAKTIPIYAMTANAFAEDVASSLSAGANGHIAKPIDSKALYQLIHKCIMEETNE